MKLLFIRFSSIGDIILTTPAIRIAKTQLGAEIHYLTKHGYLSLLKENPHIDKLHGFKKDIKSTISDLQNENFDFIIDLHHNFRSLRIKRALNVPSKSFFKANIEKWLMVNFKYDKLPKNHIVDRYLETLNEFTVKNDGEGLEFYFDPEIINDLPPLPDSFVCISLGAAHATKQIPQEKLHELLQTTTVNYVLLGGKDVEDLGSSLAKKNKQVVNLAGKVSINTSAYIVNKCIGLITGDTGMMHIGAAMKKKMIVLWGSTIPEFGMYPYYGSYGIDAVNFEQKLSCRPCSKTGHNKCPKGHFRCMMDHDMAKVRQEIHDLFGL